MTIGVAHDRKHRVLPVLIFSLMLIMAGPAAADPQTPEPEPAPILGNDILLDGGTGDGRIAVNAASGNNNQQANVAAIAIGDIGLAEGSLSQHLESPLQQAPSTASALIAGDSFAGASGMIAVNVASGSENQQANLALIAIGIEGVAVTDLALSQTRAAQQSFDESAPAPALERVTGIAPGAFAGASGLVQVNLIGGERNSSANTFALTVTAGAN